MDKQLEEITLNSWPALQSYLYDGWLLRWADGYTKRSNSVQPLYSTDNPIEIGTKIIECQNFYERAGLTPCFKITPFVQPFQLDMLLDERGYSKRDLTYVKTIGLASIREPEASGSRCPISPRNIGWNIWWLSKGSQGSGLKSFVSYFLCPAFRKAFLS